MIVMSLRMLLLCLLSGAAMSAIVAWTCALWSPMRQRQMPASPEESHWHYGWGWGWSEAAPHGWRSANGDFLYWNRSATPAVRESGLPLRCMRSTVNVDHDERRSPLSRWDLPTGEVVRRGLQTDDLPAWVRAQRARRVPLVPIWWAFFLNTAFYAVITGTATKGVRILHRQRHTRRRGFEIGQPLEAERPGNAGDT
jgi:hypothetical protein